MQLSAEQMAVIPNCPNHYFSSEGHLIPLDNQSQNTQFNFTIASINSTCEGITSPFVLSAPGILENPFIANTWEIDCPTGRIWLSDRSLTFCTTNNPPGVSFNSSFILILNSHSKLILLLLQLVASVNASVCHMSTGSYASLSVFSSPIDYHLASQLSSTFMRKIWCQLLIEVTSWSLKEENFRDDLFLIIEMNFMFIVLALSERYPWNTS